MIIQQTIYGNNYFWNDTRVRWEGLINNASDVTDKRYNELMDQWGTAEVTEDQIIETV